MRYLFGPICACAMSVPLLLGCSESSSNPGSGGSDAIRFPCTEEGIRAAIAEGGGPHRFDCDPSTPVVTELEIVIDKDVILDGEGRLAVDGNADHRVLSVSESVFATLRALKITRGVAPLGAGIWNEGTLTLDDVEVSASSAAEGGGIHNAEAGTMTLTNVVVRGNDATLGAGIFNDGIMSLEDCEVLENESGASGAGILNERQITLRGTRISDNVATGSGGGMTNAPGGDGGDGPGRATLANCVVARNQSDGNGGGIDNIGELALIDTTVAENLGGSGGGLYNIGSSVVLRSTMSDNTTPTCGGGIDNDGAVAISLSTLSSNDAGRCGGAIFNEGSLVVISSTLSGNRAASGNALSVGPPRDDRAGTTQLRNTIIEGDCEAEQPVTSNGYNIESPEDTCELNPAKGDRAGVSKEELGLGPLQDNGGAAPTHAITSDSAAFDVIPQAACTFLEDARGFSRPQGSACDVGSFELQL